MCFEMMASAIGSAASSMGGSAAKALGSIGMPNANTPMGSAESSLFGPSKAANPAGGGGMDLKALTEGLLALKPKGGGDGQQPAPLPNMPGGGQYQAPTWQSLQPQRGQNIDLETLLKLMGK